MDRGSGHQFLVESKGFFRRLRVKVLGQPGESKTSVAVRLHDRIADLDATSATAPDTVGELLDVWLRRAAPKTKSPATF